MRFSIRELLLVTVIVALGLGWWLDHRRQATTIRADEWTIESWKQTSIVRAEEIARLKQELKAAVALAPNSSAPAPSPPKP